MNLQRSDLVFSTPLLIFLGDVRDEGTAKTALGLREWRDSWCLGQWRLDGCAVDLGLPDMSPVKARDAGAATLLIGIAPDGGQIPAHWMPHLEAALAAGLHIISGLHDRLIDRPNLRELAQVNGVRLIDVRSAPPAMALPVGSGARRSGRRVLTVGTDCAIGKKYTALSIEREMKRRGIDADFRATGQTGVMISGGGIAIDAVPADFVSGVVEMMTPSAAEDHWDVIEGQGSIFHPAYAGVSLSLLHGAQPEAIVVCHDPRRRFVDFLPDFPLPTLEQCIELHLRLGSLTRPGIRCAGVTLNTRGMSAKESEALCASLQERIGLPVSDPAVHGVSSIVDSLISGGGSTR